SAPLGLQVGEQATWVDTGDPLPPDTNAVIMAEQVQELGDGRLEILASVAPWQHVRPMGEDIVATELVLPANHVLSAVDLGAIVAAGHTCVRARRRPRVAVLPTGSELVEPGSELTPGDIVEFNPVVPGVARGKPLLGSPGYPVSAILTNELFVRPLVYRLQGLPVPRRTTRTATITRKLLSPMGEDEFVRVKLGQVADRLMAAPLS